MATACIQRGNGPALHLQPAGAVAATRRGVPVLLLEKGVRWPPGLLEATAPWGSTRLSDDGGYIPDGVIRWGRRLRPIPGPAGGSVVARAPGPPAVPPVCPSWAVLNAAAGGAPVPSRRG